VRLGSDAARNLQTALAPTAPKALFVIPVKRGSRSFKTLWTPDQVRGDGMTRIGVFIIETGLQRNASAAFGFTDHT
jgi:hypothetical protein